MNKILVPLDNFSEISLNAARYAVEFAKRSGSKPIFLFLYRKDSAKPDYFKTDVSQAVEREKRIRGKIELLIDRSAMEGINIEQYECRGEYIEKVCEFVRNLSIAEIVIAVPDKKDEHYNKINKNISLLVQMTSCRILTVKEKDKEN
ncbi:MAG: universal stress protein [Desulfobacterales bacterium]|uniref:Universal stress protein n=1 Tax=Candidatus Desulfaltia bathyphila TaxID=2841697 RepID=A0A8J6N5P9_9BACT|nr:universal stress protein [Candidatus Desulfaltia bathyphila]MBL7195129.1 universal stress protein [Desulfobacterales bacterium]MBL7207936.1 universal stress protein [Desulfobacterales bacterium]